MLKPGISAIEAGIRLAFLPYPSWEEFDQLHEDLLVRGKNNKSNPRSVPNYIKGWPNLLKYDHKHDNGGVFIVNSMGEAYRNADLIIATYENQTKHQSNNDGRSTLCLSDPRTKLINRQTRFTTPSIEAWCIDQGYHLPPKMDDDTLKIFLGYLTQDPDIQFDSTFNLNCLLDELHKELYDPKPSNQHSNRYLTSYIYGLTKLRSLFSDSGIGGDALLVPPQPFEANEVHQSRPTELPKQLTGDAMSLKLFHEMENLSFKEVQFVIDPDNAVIRVTARSRQVSVAYSDLGLTLKASKVTFNAQGKLFASIIDGDTVTQDSALTRLTQKLKHAFNIDDSPFRKRKPTFTWRIPKNDRAKQAAKKRQVQFNDDIHGTKEVDQTDAWLSSIDPDYNPNDYAD